MHDDPTKRVAIQDVGKETTPEVTVTYRVIGGEWESVFKHVLNELVEYKVTLHRVQGVDVGRYIQTFLGERYKQH